MTPHRGQGHAASEAARRPARRSRARLGQAQKAGEVIAHRDPHDLPGLQLEAALAIDD